MFYKINFVAVIDKILNLEMLRICILLVCQTTTTTKYRCQLLRVKMIPFNLTYLLRQGWPSFNTIMLFFHNLYAKRITQI